MLNQTAARSTRQRTRRILIAIFAITLVSAACGSDATETAEQADSEAAAGTADDQSEAESTDSDPESEPDPSDAAASPDELIGKWLDTRFVLTVEIDADSISFSGEADVESSYSTTGTTLEITDVSGVRACAPDLVGNYEWEIVDDLLTLTLVSEECRDRGDALDGRRFARQEAEGGEAAAEASPDDLLGTWSDPGGIIWEIGADSIAITGGVATDASYTATSTRFEFEGNVCPGIVGTYEWEIVDDVLTLSLVSDACEGRGPAFDGKPWTRQ